MNTCTTFRRLAAVLAAGALALGFHSAQALTVGGKNFTEQQLMAEITTLSDPRMQIEIQVTARKRTP